MTTPNAQGGERDRSFKRHVQWRRRLVLTRAYPSLRLRLGSTGSRRLLLLLWRRSTTGVVAGLLLLWHAALLGLALVVVLLTLRLLRRHTAGALLGRTVPLLLLRARRRVLVEVEPKAGGQCKTPI